MIKREILIFVLAIFLVSSSFVSAQDAVTITEKKVVNDVIAIELDKPAEFDLSIKNNQLYTDNFEVYSLLDVIITPLGTFQIGGSETKTVRVTVMPRIKEEGRFGITYYLRGEKAGPQQAKEDTFVIEVRPFSEIVKITVPQVIHRETSSLTFEIGNPEKIDLGQGTVSLKSDFFDLEQDVSLEPGASQDIELSLKDLHGLSAGEYDLEFNFVLGDKELVAERKIQLVEVIKVTESEFKRTGLLSYTRDVIRKNDGNVDQYVMVELSQSVFERIFSRYNVKADDSHYSGLNNVFIWERRLAPGETLTIKATVDYTIPVLILVVIIIIYVGLKISKRPRLILRKKILKVKTKDNKFALKIVLVVKNIGSEISNVKIRDRLPMAAKIHERFGAVKPDKIEKNRLEWSFERLMPGEEHVLSYIIYSEVTLIGRITVPQATATYTDSEGKSNVSTSLKKYLVHEPEQKS